MVDCEFEPEEVHLFNPLTRAVIQLPPLPTFPVEQLPGSPPDIIPRTFYFRQKAMLTSDPSSDPENWALLSSVSEHYKLCFCRAGDEKWALINSDDPQLPQSVYMIEDIIHYKGKFYVVSASGVVSVCDLCSPQPKLTAIATPPFDEHLAERRHLVESSGKLLQVERFLDFEDGYPLTSLFKIHKLVEGGTKWVEVESVGDDMLFLGRNESLCFSGSDFPECEKDCIYFTDDSCL